MSLTGKENIPEKYVTLALETGIKKESFALFDQAELIDSRLSSGEVSGSEELLDEIKTGLEKNRVRKKYIKLIVVSSGPGSITGIRVGKAYAQGLSKALDCSCAIFPILEALAFDAFLDLRKDAAEFRCPLRNVKVVAAIPLGKNRVCRQTFVFGSSGSILETQKSSIKSLEDFARSLNTEEFDKLILHRSLNEYLEKTENAVLAGKKIIVRTNPAVALGRRALLENSKQEKQAKNII